MMLYLISTLIASGCLLQLSSAAYSLRGENDPMFAGIWPGRQITYCFGSETDRDKLRDIWNGGWQIWGDNLPVRPFPRNGVPDAVCTDRPTNTLIITCNHGGRYNTMVGYKAGEVHTMDFDCGTRSLRITRKAIMAHEIGHAMGLRHEHQKPHAGEQIDFTCANLRDYQLWLKKTDTETMETLCSYQESAAMRKYGPPPNDFTFTAADMLPEAEDSRQETDGRDVDFDSIMIYASNFGGRPAIPKLGERFGFRRNVLKKKDGSTFPAIEQPSRRDLAQVDRLYR